MVKQVMLIFYPLNVHLHVFMFRLAATAARGDTAIQIVNVIGKTLAGRGLQLIISPSIRTSRIR